MIGLEDAPRYGEVVKRIFGQDEVVPPGITIEGERPEYALHKRENLFFAFVAQAAVAAQFAQVGIRNGAPTAGQPGGIVVITDAVFGVSATMDIELHLYSSDAIGLQLGGISSVGVISRDTRALDQNKTIRSDPFARIGLKSGAITGAPVYKISWLTGSDSRPMDIVLGPGTEAVFAGLLVNTTLFGSFRGYSRAMRPEEAAD